MTQAHLLDLGVRPYREVWELQHRLHAAVREGREPDTWIVVEHPPVITLGRNAQVSNVLASPEFLSQRGVEVFDIDRGGDVTFHGPGQLVAYPIFDLRSFEPRIGAVEFVRRLEEVLIRTCGDFGIGAQRIKGLTGVWTYALPNEPEGKIAAIGVHISRGVTTHGLALNVSTDLEFFDLIVPCGITNKPVTSMEWELQKQISVQEVATATSRNFGRVFGSQILWLELLDDLLAQAASTAKSRAALDSESHQSPANQDTPAQTPKPLRDLHSDGSELA